MKAGWANIRGGLVESSECRRGSRRWRWIVVASVAAWLVLAAAATVAFYRP